MTEQKQKAIAEHFKAGGYLTVLECLRLYRTTELRRVVSRLKKTGMNIVGKPVPGETFKQYFLQQQLEPWPK